MHSKDLNEVEQRQLLMTSSRARKSDATPEQIARRPNLLAAINLCIDESGLADDEIRLALAIDAGHWSNIRKGKAGVHFPTNKLDDLMTLCGNEIPLEWQAMRRGKGLHLLETEAERRIRALTSQLAEEQAKTRTLQEAISGRFTNSST